eukprot:maker-scaffold565_size135592-snap-gene-0.25 protein:Tk01864 transcript:maker-scaffold565_size135592-snap-gene-0.25-mRNA-1 annotation:"hypothetical protein"
MGTGQITITFGFYASHCFKIYDLSYLFVFVASEPSRDFEGVVSEVHFGHSSHRQDDTLYPLANLFIDRAGFRLILLATALIRGFVMPRVINEKRRITNIPIGNGEFISGVRDNPKPSDQSSKNEFLAPEIKPLRYTPSLICDPTLESLRPERDRRHKTIQSGTNAKQLGYNDEFCTNADMLNHETIMNPVENSWFSSRLPGQQSRPEQERLSIPQSLLDGKDQFYPQDELSRIKERNRRFANVDANSFNNAEPYFGVLQRQPPHMILQSPPMMPMLPTSQCYYPSYPLPSKWEPQNELQILNDGLDETRKAVRPYVPQLSQVDPRKSDVGGEENLAEDVLQAIRPILTVEGSPRLHGHCMHSELIEAGQTCPLQ